MSAESGFAMLNQARYPITCFIAQQVLTPSTALSSQAKQVAAAVGPYGSSNGSHRVQPSHIGAGLYGPLVSGAVPTGSVPAKKHDIGDVHGDGDGDGADDHGDDHLETIDELVDCAEGLLRDMQGLDG